MIDINDSADSSNDLSGNRAVCPSRFVSSTSSGHPDDGVHRRANLVAHVGQEIALGPVGGFGRFFGLPQLRLRLFAPGNVGHAGAHHPSLAAGHRDQANFARHNVTVGSRCAPIQKRSICLPMPA